MIIVGEIINILDDRITVLTSDSSKRQEIDVMLTPNRAREANNRGLTVRMEIRFEVTMQTIEIAHIKLAKFWLNYIIQPAPPRPEGRSKEKGASYGDDNSWGMGRIGN